ATNRERGCEPQADLCLVAGPARVGRGIAAHRAERSPNQASFMSIATQACLTLLLLGLAFWIVVVRDTFSAVAGFVPYGLLLTSAGLSLPAVDVAMTEAAIGAGLTGALLIAAASRLGKTEVLAWREQPGRTIRVIAAISAATVSVAIMVCILCLP